MDHRDEEPSGTLERNRPRTTSTMIDRTRLLVTQYQQFLLYAIIGVSGVTLDLVVFFLLFNLAGINENVATVISTSCGIANNFALNTAFNFKVRDNLLRRFVQFYAVGVSGILLTVLLFAVFVSWLGISPNIVKVGSLLPVLVLQYGLNKVWTFK